MTDTKDEMATAIAAAASPQEPVTQLISTGFLEAGKYDEGNNAGDDADSSGLVRESSQLALKITVLTGSRKGTNASGATSLASSVYKYREENGRTYHAYKAGDGPLSGPLM
ncbi:Pro-neuropeptide Y [Madurella mycetomatis]|uniref:Pro-neuropeptide Y n=1 Tax=Madurella mycetomatis TaxID=100816 RepID=A0A175VXZ4_9PEZI|nr:Pro-neuropeptide Y [Madurella mycetomatis]